MEDVTDYVSLMKTSGIDIISHLYMGSYQGDLLMIVREGNMYGLLSTGFGSCSACDAFQAADGDEKKLLKLRDYLYKKIIWREINEFIKYLRTKEWRNEYYYNENQLPKFVDETIENLLYMYLAKI